MNISYISIYKLIIFILLINSGCNTQKQYKIIPPDKLADIYIDLTINAGIDLFKDTSASDKVSDFIVDSILQKYNYSENDMKNTIQHYNEDVLKWKEFYEKVILKLEKQYIKSD